MFIATAFHELGHAIVALARTRGRVMVILGDLERPIGGFTRGRFSFGVGVGTGGVCLCEEPDSSRADAEITVGGPVASLSMAVLAAATLIAVGGRDAAAIPGIGLTLLMLVNLWAFGFSLLPIMAAAHETNVHRAMPSDGLALARAFGWTALEPRRPHDQPRVRRPIILALAFAGAAAFTISVPLAIVLILWAAHLAARRAPAR
ncbi:MAG: hypothetical protein QOH83_2422 [Solirubrobacteraceae bacterium]|nr:hypothetical protein [Solirubrobacteraceae bacterium]